jgi:Bacterial Ig-like domain (group 3)
LTWLASGGIVVAVTVGGGLLSAGVAHAQVPPNLGTLTFDPPVGNDESVITATTSGGCTPADSYNIRVTGPNNFNYLITGTADPGFDRTAPFSVLFSQTMLDAGVLQKPPVPLVTGTYDVTLNCVDAVTQIVRATYTGALIFSSPTAYTIDAPLGTTDTQTALAVTPPSPITAGTVSTLTTTVIPSAAEGSVQFKDGSNNIGNPVTVLGGTASMTTTLAPGTHSLTAVFTGGTGFGNSTSLPVPSVVNGDFPGVTVTITTLTTLPASPVDAGTKMTLNAAVVPAAAAGTVQFKAGANNIGGPVTVSGGTALTTTTLAPGTQSLTAVFTPADPAALGASTSLAVSFVVNDNSPGLRRLTPAPR